MTAYPNLAKAMDERGFTVADLAALIGDTVGSVSMKIQGITEWTLTDALILYNTFNYSDITKLFLRLDYK